MDRFVEAVVNEDGRASLLASYDGDEDEETDEFTGDEWYIFRVN